MLYYIQIFNFHLTLYLVGVMSSLCAVPVVTYKLLSTFERKLNNKKVVAKQIAEDAKKAEALRVGTEKNKKRIAEKKAFREEIERTHVIPTCVFMGKLALREEQERIRRGIETQMDEDERWNKIILAYEKSSIEKIKSFKQSYLSGVVVSIHAKELLGKYSESGFGEALVLDVFPEEETYAFAMAECLGLVVEVDEVILDGRLSLILWKTL